MLAVVFGALGSFAWGRSPVPQAPPAAAVNGPPPEQPGTAPDGLREFPRGYWRNLSPEQREAIRRLSQEEREALAKRNGANRGVAVPGGRLSPKERRQLREQIREEHERRGRR